MAADSSGVETDRYEEAMMACRKKRRKKHITIHVTATLDLMVVTAVQVTSSRTKDSTTLRRMVKQMKQTVIDKMVFGGFLNVDKAYDADENCRLTCELASQLNIKQHEYIGRNRGKRFRRRAAEEFNPQINRYRGLDESIDSSAQPL